MDSLKNLKIIIRGAGDLATGVALRLHRSGFRCMVLLETAHPLAVRRMVSFSEAINRGEVRVEGITAKRFDETLTANEWLPDDEIPVVIDPEGTSIQTLQPHIVIDAIIAKRNTGTSKNDAELVIGLGPGFTAGQDVNCVIETMRGHGLGRVIYEGCATPDTGIPGNIGGYTHERLLRAPGAGMFKTDYNIGDSVNRGDCVATVNDAPVYADLSGVLRGLLQSATPVEQRTKLGDIDPRGKTAFCRTASDKAIAIGGGVLEAILEHFNN